MKKLFALMIAGLALTACNTIQGMGKDLEKAGSAVENAAKR
jgi:predicted small secreted protein